MHLSLSSLKRLHIRQKYRNVSKYNLVSVLSRLFFIYLFGVKILKVLGITLNTCFLKPESRGSSDELCGVGWWCSFHRSAWL